MLAEGSITSEYTAKDVKFIDPSVVSFLCTLCLM